VKTLARPVNLWPDMAHYKYDKNTKWLVRKHGNSILYFGGVRQVRRWRALQTELVEPNKLPDGLLEVYFQGRSTPDYFLLEIATYPEKRALEQALKDLTLAYQHLHVLPELLTVVLYPRGQFRLTGDHALTSRLEWSHLACRWKIVELWQLAAEDLLAAGDVGLVPWVPLTRFQGPPTPLLEECRRRIDKLARPEEHDNLLAVSQVLVQLRYNDPKLLAILGGKQAMIESPLIKEIVAENRQEDIVEILRTRFGNVPEEMVERLRKISADRKLRALLKHAVGCPNLESFRKRLS
jgi:hypothetical protein